jgi:hypothetical protein
MRAHLLVHCQPRRGRARAIEGRPDGGVGQGQCIVSAGQRAPRSFATEPVRARRQHCARVRVSDCTAGPTSAATGHRRGLARAASPARAVAAGRDVRARMPYLAGGADNAPRDRSGPGVMHGACAVRTRALWWARYVGSSWDSEDCEPVTIGVVTGNYDDTAGAPSLVSIRHAPAYHTTVAHRDRACSAAPRTTAGVASMLHVAPPHGTCTGRTERAGHCAKSAPSAFDSARRSFAERGPASRTAW